MKSGLDFFPLDVALDEKWELIEAEFGLTGFSVVVKLLQRIYGGQGYYCEWTSEVALLFAKKIGLGGNVVSEIASAAIKRGIFNETLYEKYAILTSSGIQKRYFEAVSRRKNVSVDPRYLLVPYAQKKNDADNSGKNADILPENADIFEQSKGKESKVNTLSACARGIRQNVILTDEQYADLKANLPGIDAFIDKFSEKMFEKGYSYPDHYIAILNWYHQDHKADRHLRESQAMKRRENGVSALPHRVGNDCDEFWHAAVKASYGEEMMKNACLQMTDRHLGGKERNQK